MKDEGSMAKRTHPDHPAPYTAKILRTTIAPSLVDYRCELFKESQPSVITKQLKRAGLPRGLWS